MKFRGRKGDLHWAYIFGAIIAVLILYIVLSGTWKGLAPVIYFVKLFGFQTALPEGNGIIGVNVNTGDLEYYTGDSWEDFANEKVFLLAGHEFNILDTKNKINDFYKAQRRPSNLVIEINHWRYLSAYLDGPNMTLKTGTKKGYVGTNYEETYKMGVDNVITYAGDFNVVQFSKFEISDPIKNNLISWRDSILEGNKCEKYLTLSVKQNNVEKDLTYTLKKDGSYVFLDLTKPTPPGKDKWSDLDCFKFSNYKDENREFTKIPLTVQIIDSGLKDKIENNRLNFYFDFNSNVWSWPDTKYSTYWGIWTEEKYVLDDFTRNSFANGLAGIIVIGKRDITSFTTGFGNPDNLDVVKELSSEELRDINRAVYSILDEYNKLLIPRVVS